MAILQKDYQRDPNLGYAKDIKVFMKELLPLCIEKNVKIMTNAGGINPYGAKKVVEQQLEEMGLNAKVAVVTGDNLMGSLEVLEEKDLLINMQNNTPFNSEEHDVSFVNAYIGARPLVEALDE